MIGYLEKFKSLPLDIKQKFSSANTMQAISELEKKYGVKLAIMIVQIMVGDVYFNNLTANFVREFNLEPGRAQELERELKEKILASVWSYLESSFSPKASPVMGQEKPGKGQSILPKSRIKKLPKKLDFSHLLPKEEKEASTFLEEDEKEIEEIKKAISKQGTMVGAKDGTKEKIEGIISQAKISFTSNNLASRFKQIVSTYLKGVRGKVDVKGAMTRPIANGGLGLEGAQADKILMLAEKAKREKSEKAEKEMVNIKSTENGSNFIFKEGEIKEVLQEREKAIKKREVGARDVDYDLASALKEKESLPKESRLEPLQEVEVFEKEVVTTDLRQKGQEDVPSKPPFIPPKAKKPVDIDKFKKDSILGQSPKGAELKRAEIKGVRKAVRSAGKKKMDDIKTPKIMGPIDELAYMDLITFRRLDADATKRTKKIEEKINLLAREEGIDKMIEGIKAWRLNPVNKTYLQIGEESIGEGKSVDDIIRERKKKNLNYLDKEEFNAVMDLNRELRF